MSLPGIRVATFDCYGTLIDWEGGVGAFLYDLALRNGERQPEPGWALRDRWEAIQFEIIQGDYRPYRAVLAESLRRWVAEHGYVWHEAEGAALVRSMRSWQPFPDVRPALWRAREAGLRLAIISNTDRDIIEHSLRHLAVPFDAVITAEDCRAYKPALAVFEAALARIGESPEQVLHVAFGFKYDIGPARRLGCRTAWVDRHAARSAGGAVAQREPVGRAEGPASGDQPEYTWRDLWGLADLVGGEAD